MSVFNKKGVEFGHPVCIQSDPTVDPTYSYKFPTIKNGQIVELWASKVRPIKDLTGLLRGCHLRRYEDYMVEYGDVKPGFYTYWFKAGATATMFGLITSTMKQGRQSPGPKFNIQCPHCQQPFNTDDITWV